MSIIRKSRVWDTFPESLGWDIKKFDLVWDKLAEVDEFKANGNIKSVCSDFDEDMLLLMRYQVATMLEDVFTVMKILPDENTRETPMRIAKVWCGDSLECDTELGGGRFSNEVRLPTFPNTRGDNKWITKKVRLISTCSHHFLPFVGEAIISYKPKDFVLGISKLQRLTNYIANRFWLQEDLTYELHKAIKEAAAVDDADVKVTIVAKHGCEMHRGVKNQDCDFTTEE